MVNALTRGCRHLWASLTLSRPARDAALCRAIEGEITSAESTHEGEIVFAIETALSLGHIWAGVEPRQRAEQVFAGLRVWDTADNNGVLVYVLLAEHAIEIVADRAVSAKVSDEQWQQLCRDAVPAFCGGHYADGSRQLIRGVAAHLARHWPASGRKGNELPNQPVLL